MSIEKEKEKGVHRPEGSAVTKPLRLQFIQEMATANWNKLYDRYYRYSRIVEWEQGLVFLYFMTDQEARGVQNAMG
jgi:hypothetical protein